MKYNKQDVKTVKVIHSVVYDAKMNPKVERAGRAIIQRVQHHYIGGKISTITGDVWDVVPNQNKKESDYITVLPKKGK
jgi:hypothetical protein